MKKVLIAEDEASIREFIVINLKRSGYDVVEAENGEEAINCFWRIRKSDIARVARRAAASANLARRKTTPRKS